MSFQVGQGVLGKIRFVDGEFPAYNPPFLLPSFVKQDSLTKVDQADWGELKVLHSGETLDEVEVARIKELL